MTAGQRASNPSGIGWVDPVVTDMRKRRPRGRFIAVPYVVRELADIERLLADRKHVAALRRIRKMLRGLTAPASRG